MTRAEEAALEAYPQKDSKVWTSKFGSFEFDGNYDGRKAYQEGYEQATKDTIERTIAWLKEHANEYIVDLTPTFPDAPANIIVGGTCWEHLKNYLQNEETKQ